MNLLFSLSIILHLFTGSTDGPVEWTPLMEQDGVKVSYKHIDCDKCGPKQEWIVLKLENTNAHNVSVSWFQEVWYGGKCTGCDKNPEQFRSVDIPAGGSRQGECQSSQSPLSIWVRFHEFQMEDELADYKLADFEVLKVK